MHPSSVANKASSAVAILIIIMDFIPLLRLRKSAMADCLNHGDLPTERKQKLQ